MFGTRRSRADDDINGSFIVARAKAGSPLRPATAHSFRPQPRPFRAIEFCAGTMQPEFNAKTPSGKDAKQAKQILNTKMLGLATTKW